MKLLASLLVFTLVTSAVTASDSAQVREILDKHVEAMGGWKNWNQVESIRINGTIERDGQTVDIVIVKKRPNQIRATVTLPFPGNPEEKLQIIRAHDGKTAWTATRLAGQPDLKKEELDDDVAAELLTDAGVLPTLIKFRQAGAQFELLEPASFEGQAVHVLQTQGPAPEQNSLYSFYLDAESFRTVHIKTQRKGLTEGLTYFDYQPHEGIYLPTRSIVEASTTGRSEMITHSTEIGVGIYEEYFQNAPTERPLVSGNP